MEIKTRELSLMASISFINSNFVVLSLNTLRVAPSWRASIHCSTARFPQCDTSYSLVILVIVRKGELFSKCTQSEALVNGAISLEYGPYVILSPVTLVMPTVLCFSTRVDANFTVVRWWEVGYGEKKYALS